jgi:acyl-CoA thioester hydrolase
MARTDYRLLHTLRVRWAEVDRQGIVFNGHYLTYFDIGVTEYWRAIGYPYPDGLAEHGTDLYVVKATVEYHTSAVYDDLIDIGMRCARIGRSSMQFLPEICRGDELLVSGELVYVNANPVTKKPAPVPYFLREAIRAFEVVAPVFASNL